MEGSSQKRRAQTRVSLTAFSNRSTDDVATRRKIIYGVSVALISLTQLYVRHSTWQGSAQLHTLMELAATLLALTVGVLALVRFYSKKDNTFLFIGTGFIGTGLLDGYHAAVTCSVFMNYFPSSPPSLIAWSWLASRLFLSVLLWLSWVFWKKEARLGESGRVPESLVYLIVSIWTLSCFVFFAFVPLPRAYEIVPIFHRPQEFIPAFFFLLALLGYLRKGRWKSDSFEHWLVLSIIVSFVGQVVFMSTSATVYDAMFDLAHLLKKLSYICTLTGLIVSMYHLFMAEESIVADRTKELREEISERKRAEEALRQAEQKYREIFEDAVVGIFQITLDGRFLSANRALAQMYGYDAPEQLIAGVTDVARQLFVEPNRFGEVTQLLEQRGVVRNVELEVYSKDGSKKWILANLRAVRGADGKTLRREGTAQDITERKDAEKQVHVMAYYDALTGLPNRTLLQDRISVALARARRHREKVALLFIDLDQFKSINDSLGHPVGDLLLKEVAERLRKWAREQDTVARLAGDEFVVLLTTIRETADAAVAAQRIIDSMGQAFVIRDHRLNVGCSIGISIFPDDCTAADTLVKNADIAMYCTKQSGRNGFQFFTHDMSAHAMERLRLENSLRGALQRKEFFLVYQPQVDLVTGRITGVEALLRWRQSELGLVPPDKFIPFAEKNGLIIPIGEWVLRTACAQARQWHDEGLPQVPVAVNVSTIQFRQRNFVDIIRNALRDTGLDPQWLELELTESLLMSNADVMISVLQKLRDMGVKLSIDDFGTGYSSLSYLRHFPVYKLKIDRSFVRDLTTDSDDAAITDTIIQMAKSLDLTVVAEGVESMDQVSFLRQHKCDEVQGYYFSKPLSAEEFALFQSDFATANRL